MSVNDAVQTYKDKIGPITEAYEKQKKILGEEVSRLLSPAIKELFEQEDINLTVEVNAYVPYFNDGDACEYSVYVIEEAEDEETGEWVSFYDKPWFKKVEELIYSIPEDVLEDTFGSHTKFYLSKDGFTVEEYHNHD